MGEICLCSSSSILPSLGTFWLKTAIPIVSSLARYSGYHEITKFLPSCPPSPSPNTVLVILGLLLYNFQAPTGGYLYKEQKGSTIFNPTETNDLCLGAISSYVYFKPSSKDVHAYVSNINFLWHFCCTKVEWYQFLYLSVPTELRKIAQPIFMYCKQYV